MFKWLMAIIALLIAILGSAFFSQPLLQAVIDTAGPIPVCLGAPSILNGDTVECFHWRIQIEDFDAPETAGGAPPCEAEKGRRAAEELAKAVAGKDVTVLMTNSKSDFGDAKGRLEINGISIFSVLSTITDPAGGRLFCPPRVENWCVTKPC
jgi:endonuclease YncB( thermonuclease family)